MNPLGRYLATKIATHADFSGLLVGSLVRCIDTGVLYTVTSLDNECGAPEVVRMRDGRSCLLLFNFEAFAG